MRTPTYPHAPGSKGGTDTGTVSAMRVESKAKVVRDKVREAYQGSGLGMTHDECAALLRPQSMDDVQFERFKLTVRSRASELKAAGLLGQLKDRRANDSGHAAVVWRHVRFDPPTQPPKQQELL